MHRMDLPTRAAAAQAAAGAPAQPFAAGGLWLGAMVPKRWARRAVTRNLIKRQIYSLGEQHLGAAADAAYLVRLRSGYDRLQFRSAASDALKASVRAEIEQLFARAARAPKAAA